MQNNVNEKVKLFHVPLNHRGSTEHILKEAVKNLEWPDYSGIIYIAPTPAKTRDAQKKFHSLVKSPYIPPVFFTFKQFSKNLFDVETPGRYIPQILIPLLLSEISGHSIGYSELLSRLLKELKQHHPLKEINLVHKELSEIFRRLGIPEDALKRLDAAFAIFSTYQETLSRLNAYDEDDVLNYSRAAASRVTRRFSAFIADGFYEMTASEINLFEELIKKSKKTFVSIPETSHSASRYLIDFIKSGFAVMEHFFKAQSETDLSYVKYNGIEEEIQGIAGHIKNSIISGRIKTGDSVIVTVSAPADYAELAERVFKRYGLPYSVLLRKSSAKRRALRDVLYMLESVAGDFPRLKFATALSSPVFKNISELLKKHIPSLSLESGIIKGRENWENIGSFAKDSDTEKEVNKEIARIFNIFGRLIAIKESAAFDSFSLEIEKALAELGFEAVQEDIEGIKSSMEKMGVIFSLTEKENISFTRYVEFLRHILGSAEYEHKDEGIRIMDFMETRGLEPDYLYFCGLKDGDLPSRPPVDHILPDSVRTEYGLVNLTAYLATQKLNFLRITCASSHRHLSFPAIDGDNLFLPSPYLPWGKEIPEKIPGIFSMEEKQVRLGSNLFGDTIKEINLSSGLKEKLLKKELSMPLRVTDIDYFRKCPRRFFIEKIMHLEASEIVKYEVEAKILGTIAHRIMEDLIKEPVDDLMNFKEKASSIISLILGDYKIEDYWKKLIKEAFVETLPEMLELESEFRGEGFMPYELEKNIKGDVLPGISLKGKIDRIDRNDDLYRIIDYKTGAVTAGSDIIKKGKELQLPLYVAMLKAQGLKIEKAGIYSLKDLSIKWIPTKRDKNTLDEYLKAALMFLEETVKDIKDGSFIARPLEEFYCSSCLEAPFCPYINSKGENTAVQNNLKKGWISNKHNDNQLS